MLTSQLLKTLMPLPLFGIRPHDNAGVPSAGGETIADILGRASERADQASLEYIGLVTPHEAMRLMAAAGARLVDVRTPSERARAGHVLGSVPIAWHAKAECAAARRFVEQLKRKVKPDEIVMFLSRNGERSHRAACAAAAVGYVHALSVLEGYDGERVGGRRTRGGWRRRQVMRGAKDALEVALDEALVETFPASDPIAVHPDTGAPADNPESRERE